MEIIATVRPLVRNYVEEGKLAKVEDLVVRRREKSTKEETKKEGKEKFGQNYLHIFF